MTGVTYNGVAMTLGGSLNGSDGDRTTLFYLVAPATGANNVVVTFSATTFSAVAGAVSFSGVHQSAPVGSYVSASGTSTAPSVNASSEAGGMVIDCLAVAVGGAPSVGASQTQRWNDNETTGGETGAGSTEAGAASVTMSWSLGSSYAWAIGALPLKAAPDASGRLQLLGAG